VPSMVREHGSFRRLASRVSSVMLSIYNIWYGALPIR